MSHNKMWYRRAQITLACASFCWTLVAGWLVIHFDLARLTPPPELTVPLGIPVVLTASAMIAALRRWTISLTVLTILLASYAFLTLFSVGILYIPSILALIFVMIIAHTESP